MNTTVPPRKQFDDSFCDVLAVVATYSPDADEDADYARRQWLTGGLRQFVRAELDERENDITRPLRNPEDLQQAIAEIVLTALLVQQHRMRSGGAAPAGNGGDVSKPPLWAE